MNILMFTFHAATYFANQTIYPYVQLCHITYQVLLPPCLIIVLTVTSCIAFFKKYLQILICHNKPLMKTKIEATPSSSSKYLQKTTLDTVKLHLKSIKTLYCTRLTI